MILTALYELYGRLAADASVTIPIMGTSAQKIGFRIILKPDGELVRIEDARETEISLKKGKEVSKLVVREKLVLGEAKPSGSGINPCFLWDNAAYLLGYTDVKERALDYFAETRRKHLEVEAQINSRAYSAVCRFLEQWDPARCAEFFPGKDLFTTNGVFQILGEEEDVHEEAAVRRWWQETGLTTWRGGADNAAAVQGTCLITGETAPIAQLHNPAIKGVRDAQSSGAKLVSFNLAAFNSYGKDQSYNAPVSEKAAFAYCNALNYLLGQQRNRIQIGDATTVFWTDAPRPSATLLEGFVHLSLDNTETPLWDEKTAGIIRDNLKRLATGQQCHDMSADAAQTRFYILGLSPNAARLSIRFFLESDMGDFLRRMQAHFTALQLQPRHEKFKDPDLITPYHILRETVRDSKDLPPLYSGALMNAILTGSPYPDAIAGAILRRIRVDGDINYIRCAYLKAWLTRKTTTYTLTPMLDTENTQPGYVLGRLFAALVKTQEEALPGLNRTMKDAFYASACATPQIVFPRIMKLHLHHLAKLEGGKRVHREKTVQEIMALLSGFPARLTMEQQGLFALGYYHQTQSFYTPKNTEQ